MLYKVFDFAGKEVHEVMVPRPEVVAISVDLPPEECLAAVIDSPYTRYPAYKGSLDDIVGILHVRDLFSALNDRGIANVVIEEILAARVRRARDEGPRRAPRGLPPHEAAHGDRRRRVRRDGGDRHARGPARGDRRRDRGRVRPPGRGGRARRRADDPDRRHVPDRRLQRAVRDRAAAGGLPHGRRLRLRPARASAGGGRRGRSATACSSACSTIEGTRIERLEVHWLDLPEEEEQPVAAEG